MVGCWDGDSSLYNTPVVKKTSSESSHSGGMSETLFKNQRENWRNTLDVSYIQSQHLYACVQKHSYMQHSPYNFSHLPTYI